MIKYLILFFLGLTIFGCLEKAEEKQNTFKVYEIAYKNKTVVCVASRYANSIITPDCNWDEYNKVKLVTTENLATNLNCSLVEMQSDEYTNETCINALTNETMSGRDCPSNKIHKYIEVCQKVN